MDGTAVIQDQPASVTPAEPDPATSGSTPSPATPSPATPSPATPAGSGTLEAAPAASAPTTSAPPDGEKKAPYPPPASLPTQLGPEGIRFDFNHGARVILPNRTEGKWRVRLRDLDTGNILFQSENQGAFVSSAKRFYVRFSVEVWSLDAEGAPTSVLSHDYDARGQEILIQFPIGTLGDILAWFPYAPRFAEVHGCRLICAMSELLIPLLRDAYPEIRFVTHEELTEQKLADTVYATYCLGLFFDDKDFIHQPTDFRHVGLHRTAGYILGVDPTEEPARLGVPDEGPPIDEPYVCIAVQSSTQSKNWTNPYGWREVVAFLKSSGYRVVCIDKNPVHGTGLVWNHVPHGVDDQTGDRPLAERVRWLRHAKAFVGLSSGLSWLAWSAGVPVVLISGFTHPTNEFTTPYRVINWHACNGCWNDVRHRFDHKDYLWCPRHANTPRQFECTRLITASQVIATLKRIPGLIDSPAPSPVVIELPTPTLPASSLPASGPAALKPAPAARKSKDPRS
jgi:autotransporter strand-loop-strand O-heptosyltransferase